jgi:hypothetical protein
MAATAPEETSSAMEPALATVASSAATAARSPVCCYWWWCECRGVVGGWGGGGWRKWTSKSVLHTDTHTSSASSALVSHVSTPRTISAQLAGELRQLGVGGSGSSGGGNGGGHCVCGCSTCTQPGGQQQIGSSGAQINAHLRVVNNRALRSLCITAGPARCARTCRHCGYDGLVVAGALCCARPSDPGRWCKSALPSRKAPHPASQSPCAAVYGPPHLLGEPVTCLGRPGST